MYPYNQLKITFSFSNPKITKKKQKNITTMSTINHQKLIFQSSETKIKQSKKK